MSTEQDIEGDVIVDTSAVEKTTAAPGGERRSDSVMTEESLSALDEMKRTLAAEKAQREEIERMLAAERAARQREASASNLSQVEIALETYKAKAREEQVALREAHERGDFETVAKATENVADLRVKMLALEQGRDALRAQQSASPQPQRRAPQTPEERIAAVTPKSRQFLQDRPEYVQDEAMTRRLAFFHAEAVAAGHEVESDGYFDYIDDNMIPLIKQARGEASPPRRDPPAPRRGTPPAPVQRGPAAIRGDRDSNIVTLTRAEAEIADSMGIPREVYAKNKRDMRRNGEL